MAGTEGKIVIFADERRVNDYEEEMDMRQENVVWDWNGTLLDDVAVSVGALNRMLGRRGLPKVTLEEYRAKFGFPVRPFYEGLGFDFGRDDWDGVSREYVRDYDALSGEVWLTEGAVEVLAELKAEGRRLYVLSALQEDLLLGMLERFGIRRYFDGVCGALDIYADGKVERGRSMVGRYAIDPGNTLMVGDTLHDAEVAEALGFDVCLYAGGHNSEARLREKGRVVGRMADLLRLP